MARIRAKALAAASYVALNQGDLDWATTLCEENLALSQELGDIAGIAGILAQEASAGGTGGNARTASMAAVTEPLPNERSRSPLEKRREELERGAGGDHDLPHEFTLPTSMPQVHAWTKLLLRVQNGDLQPEVVAVGAGSGNGHAQVVSRPWLAHQRRLAGHWCGHRGHTGYNGRRRICNRGMVAVSVCPTTLPS
jgi:hypothetical protein